MWKLSDNSTFETTFYRVTSEKIGENIRAVVLADLHNNVFGQDKGCSQKGLLKNGIKLQ